MMKYIVYKSHSGLESPVIFNEIETHKDVFFALVQQGLTHETKLISAGFVSIGKSYDPLSETGFDVSCSGKSDTLKTVSRMSTDAHLIERLISASGW